MYAVRHDPVPRALADIRAGRPVVVLDEDDPESAGSLIFAAESATPALVAFMVRYTSGFVGVALPADETDRLELPPMVRSDQHRRGLAYTVTVDARSDVTTGISATDRAHTIRLLADPASTATDFTRPGHVLPIRAVGGGVLGRAAPTEAALDLTRLSGRRPAGVLCGLVSERQPTGMARADELRAFADAHGLALISIPDLVTHRRRTDKLVARVASARVPLRHGEFTAVGYASSDDLREHVAFVLGDLDAGADVLVRVHSECVTGDLFGSLRCDCGPQLDAALAAVAREGRGAVLYIRAREGGAGRGTGLLHKLQAYERQDAGETDSVLPSAPTAEAGDYATSAQILADLGIRSIRLLSGNPAKRTALEGYGLRVTAQLADWARAGTLPY